MCGIAGRFSSTKIVEPLDINTLAHRGPDATGTWNSENGLVWLGNTRLSILDLTINGNQPMHDPKTGNVIVFNGEIYNHLEIRKELAPLFKDWISTSDTETILIGYRFWGTDIITRLSGMFAVGVYDASNRSLLLSRDRMGIKPLYYRISGERIDFASEVRTLMHIREEAVDPESISAFLQWGACPDDQLLFPEIKSVPAGYWMVVDRTGVRRTYKYWPPSKPAKPLPTDQHYAHPAREVRDLLERSVERHLLSDVPVGMFLSGGLDSTILTAIASRVYGKRLRTFTVGFESKLLDESESALEVAQFYGTDHETIKVAEEEALQLVQEAVFKMDLPSVDAINTYIVARKVSEKGMKVAFSGLGADELFGGYRNFRDVQAMKLAQLLPEKVRERFRPFGTYGKFLANLPSNRDAYVLAHWRRSFWTAEMLHDAGLPEVPFVLRDMPDLPDDFARTSWAELSYYTRDMLLRDTDQMSMAVSLEVRVPYLDNDLVEYVLSLPMRSKSRPNTKKWLLVESVKDLLPDRRWKRRKQGFALPMDEWMRGPLRSFVEEGLDRTSHLTSLPEVVPARLRREFFEKRVIHWTRLWSVVVLGHFLHRELMRQQSGRNFQREPILREAHR